MNYANPIRYWREKRSMRVCELARAWNRLEVARGATARVSQYERGATHCPERVTRLFATILRVPNLADDYKQWWEARKAVAKYDARNPTDMGVPMYDDGEDL